MKKLSILAALLVLALVTRFVAADAAKDDATKIKGTWMIERADSDKDGPMPEEERIKGTMVIDATNMTMYGMNEDGSGDPAGYTLDTNKTPGWVDLLPPAKGIPAIAGIYKLEGDKLTLCLSQGGVRPTDFVMGPGQGSVIIVLKRIGLSTTQPSTRPDTKPSTRP